MVNKKCAMCKETKPIDSFGKDKKRRDGVRCYCKKCVSVISKQWRLTHLDLEKEREKKRIWRKNNPERSKEIRMNWYYSNQELCKQLSKQWYYSNPDKVYAYHVEKYKRDPDRYKQSAILWAKKNPMKVAATRHRRRAVSGSFTSEHIKNLVESQGNKCKYCNINLHKFHIDHIIPLALGGTSDPENIQLLCPTCNLRKGAKHPNTFERLLNVVTR